jgi:NTE family protein
MGVRADLDAAWSALAAAVHVDEWQIAAERIDELTGADAWRGEPTSIHYDADAIQADIAALKAQRAQGDPEALADTLSASLYRHQTDIADRDLYDVALGGTKHLIETYLQTCESSLEWLASVEMPPDAAARRLERFHVAWRVYGRSALMLSGGATLGFHHLGVVKALFEAGLLPKILTGASTGAMIAAGVCVRDDTELADLFANPRQMRLDGLVPAGVKQLVRTGAWLDPQGLYDVLLHNVGDATFAEARVHSGRSLNISVSANRTRQKPRLLSYLTAPDVLVARAALASSALPGLFPPTQLIRKRRDGTLEPYLPDERWTDGSLDGDLPKLRLSRLHNANHFIVSQTNPHVLPFMRHRGRSGLRPAVSGLVSTAARTQGATVADIVRRATRRSNGPVQLAARQAHNLLSQDYTGDIDLHPQFRWSLYRKVVSNPTYEDLDAFILEGERSVWPHLARIRNATRIGRAFDRCLDRLS